MALVSFKVRRELQKEGSNRVPIYMVVNPKEEIGATPSTGLWIDKELWPQGNGYPLVNGKNAGRTKFIRDKLDEMRGKMETWYYEFCEREGREPTKEEIKAKGREVSQRRNNAVKSGPTTVLEAFDQFIEESKRRKRASTIKKYGSVRRHLEEFAPSRKLERVDVEYGEAFKAHLVEELGIQTSTVDRDLRTFKAFLGWAEEKGQVQVGTGKNIANVKVPATYPNPLREKEKKVLEEAELSGWEKFDRTRDLLLFTCYTGMRFGDLMDLTPENFIEEGTRLEYKMNKTLHNMNTELIGKAHAIAEKYNRELPQISEQKHNKNLKALFKHLGLDRMVKKARHYGYNGETVRPYQKPLYEVASSHIGRQTFITQLLLNGASPELVRDLAGHVSFDAMRKYIEFAREDKKKALETL